MSKLRVLHILNTNKYSGAENVVITIIKNMRDYVDCGYESLDGPIRDVLKENNIAFFPVDKTKPSEIKRVISAFHPDIIHAHDYTDGMAAVFTGTRIPIINHLHNNSPWLKRYGIRSISYGFCANRFNKILTVSDSIMNEYVFGSYFKSKTVTVGNPIDLNRIRALARVMSTEDILETKKEYDIAFLGRETPQKNPIRLLKIIRLVKDCLKEKMTDKSTDEFQVHGLKAIMIGDGEMRDDVNAEIKRLRLEENITCVGFQSNPYKYLKTAKVMVMPSLWEGFGLAAVEGIALGLPVVASPVGGLVDIVNDRCGKLCETDQEFVGELVKLLTDGQYYKKKSDGAIKRAYDFDNLDSYMKQIYNAYMEVLKGQK